MKKGKGKGKATVAPDRTPTKALDETFGDTSKRKATLLERLPLFLNPQAKCSASVEESQSTMDFDAEPELDPELMQDDPEAPCEQDSDNERLTTPTTEDWKVSSISRRGGLRDLDTKRAQELEVFEVMYREEVESSEVARAAEAFDSRAWPERPDSPAGGRDQPRLPSVSNPGVHLSPAGFPPGSSRFPMCDPEEAKEPEELPPARPFLPLGALRLYTQRILANVGMGALPRSERRRAHVSDTDNSPMSSSGRT